MPGRDALKGERSRLAFERELWSRGILNVAGADEAGCGPLAGPVVAAAVVLPASWLDSGLPGAFRGLTDSKQLTEQQRDTYYERIVGHEGVRHAIARVEVEMIDRINIRQAAWRAMNQALDRLSPRPDHALVDGLKIRWLPYAQTALVKGDARSYSIAAASVLAKVTRDRLMVDYDRVYPDYGFAEHKGYGTPRHLEAIQKYGACPIHRRTFAPFRSRAEELDLFEAAESRTVTELSPAPPPGYPLARVTTGDVQ